MRFVQRSAALWGPSGAHAAPSALHQVHAGPHERTATTSEDVDWELKRCHDRRALRLLVRKACPAHRSGFRGPQAEGTMTSVEGQGQFV